MSGVKDFNYVSKGNVQLEKSGVSNGTNDNYIKGVDNNNDDEVDLTELFVETAEKEKMNNDISEKERLSLEIRELENEVFEVEEEIYELKERINELRDRRDWVNDSEREDVDKQIYDMEKELAKQEERRNELNDILNRKEKDYDEQYRENVYLDARDEEALKKEIDDISNSIKKEKDKLDRILKSKYSESYSKDKERIIDNINKLERIKSEKENDYLTITTKFVSANDEEKTTFYVN